VFVYYTKHLERIKKHAKNSEPVDCWPAPNKTEPKTFVLALAALGCPPRPPNMLVVPNILVEPSIG